MFDVASPVAAVWLVLTYPIYILGMAGVLAVCGVSRKDIAKWALRQAERQRLADLFRAVRSTRHPGSANEVISAADGAGSRDDTHG